MRFKCIFSAVLLCCWASASAMPAERNDAKIANKEAHCLALCKKFEGEPFYDKFSEKCYCSIREESVLLNKEHKEAMRMNAKIHDLNLIIQEFANRDRRSEPETDVADVPTDEPTAADEVVGDAADNAESNSETQTEQSDAEQPAEQADPIVEAAEPPTEDQETNTDIVEAENPEDDNTIPENTDTDNEVAEAEPSDAIEKPRKLPKIAGARRTLGARPGQNIDVDEMLHNAHQQMESVINMRQSGQPPKEAHTRVKEIQSQLNQIASRLRNEDQGTLVGSRHRETDNGQMAGESTNIQETTVDSESESTIVGRRRTIHHPRVHNRPSIRARENKEEAERKEEATKHRIALNRRGGPRTRLGAAKTETESEVPAEELPVQPCDPDTGNDVLEAIENEVGTE